MNDLAGYMSVAEAARTLSVTREHVRDLVKSGALRAAKLDRELLVRSADVHHRKLVVRPRQGAPLSPRIAWAVLIAVSGGPTPWISSSERVRVRRYTSRPLTDWPRLLIKRAGRVSARMLPGALKKLSCAPDVAIGGVHAAIHHGTDLVVSETEPTHLYISAHLYDRTRDARGVAWGSEASNVVAHVLPPLPDTALAAVLGHAYVPPAVAAADLLDQGDERSVRSAATILDRTRP